MGRETGPARWNSQGIEEFFAHVHDGGQRSDLPMSSDTSHSKLAKGSVRRHWEVKKDWEVRQKTSIPWEFSGRNDPHPYVADITDVASSTRIRTPSPTRYGTNAPMLWCATNFSNHATVP